MPFFSTLIPKGKNYYLVLAGEKKAKSINEHMLSGGQYSKSCQNFKEKNHTIGLAIPLLTMFPKEVLHICKYVCTKMFIVQMFNTLKNWKLTKFSTIKEWSTKSARWAQTEKTPQSLNMK